MKNKLRNIFGIFLATTLFVAGCKKDFLEEPKPATAVSASDVFASEAGVRSFLNGIYRNLRIQWGSATDAWGIASVNIAREIKGLDIGSPSQNWYSFDYLHDNREPTYRRTNFTWDYFYSMINASNNLIDGVRASSLPTTPKLQLEAEGRAFRAWCYFELVREFAPAYVSNPTGPGLPLYTSSTSSATSGQPRVSIEDVYELILDDLEFALANIPATRANGGLKDVINKDVVNGLLARVYLEMGMVDNAMLSKAITAAQAARVGYPLTVSQASVAITTGSLVGSAMPEVIWGFPQQSDQTIYYGTPSAFFGTAGVGYFNFFVDDNFVSTFSSTDVRRSLIVNPVGSSYTGPRKWKTNKFGATTSFTDNLVMMRSPEMILIEAEAKARLNDPTAGDVLYTLQKNRDPNAVKSGNTGSALINEILLEKRKELYGEIGIGYLDLRRTGKSLVRSNGHVTSAQITLDPNDKRFTLKIPQKEFDSNPALTAADQNQ